MSISQVLFYFLKSVTHSFVGPRRFLEYSGLITEAGTWTYTVVSNGVHHCTKPLIEYEMLYSWKFTFSSLFTQFRRKLVFLFTRETQISFLHLTQLYDETLKHLYAAFTASYIYSCHRTKVINSDIIWILNYVNLINSINGLYTY